MLNNGNRLIDEFLLISSQWRHVFATKSKEGYGPSLGLDFLRKACQSTSVPIFGLGGMNPERIDPVMQTGAVGIAGISLFQNPAEFARLRKLRTSL